MLLLVLLLLSPAQSNANALPFERIDMAAAVERLSRCGLGRVTARYEDEGQVTILTPDAAAAATDAQLACADLAISFYDIDLPLDVQARFDAIRAARLRPFYVGQARQRLSERGLRAPNYVAGQTDNATFAGEVERRCGPRARGAFDPAYDHLAISRSWMMREMENGSPDFPAFACVTDMAVSSNYPLSFIGNEAIAAPVD
jgi:hypothetical protein